LVVLNPPLNVELEGLLKVGDHLFRPRRTPNGQRAIASRTHQPTGEPQIGKADDVIGVQVGKEYGVDVLPSDLELGEALNRTASCVKEESLTRGLHQRAGPEPIHHRRRTTRAQQSDHNLLPVNGTREESEHG
jgi:hypothetical protein